MIGVEQKNQKLIQVFSIKEHQKTRDEILNIYDTMYKAIHENVDDYYTKYRLKNREFIFNYLKPYFLEYANSWNYSDVHMKIMWFIQYENNNQQNQGWHGHDYTSLPLSIF